MANILTTKTDISSLRDCQLKELFNYIGEIITIGTFESFINDKWLKKFNDEKHIVRTKNMLIHSVIPFVDIQIKGYKERETKFIQ